MPFTRSAVVSALALFAFLSPWPAASAAFSEAVDVTFESSALRFDVREPHAGATLRVRGPSDYSFSRSFDAAESLVFQALARDGGPLPDGPYVFELRLTPFVSGALRKQLQGAREDGLLPRTEARPAPAEADSRALVTSGAFTVADGEVLIPGDLQEEGGEVEGSIAEPTSLGGLETISGQDQVIADDLIVQRSLCAGTDCSNTEAFGLDVLRLRENTLRFHFLDTSTSSGYPSNDWRLMANDSFSGGIDYFAIHDATSNLTPFTIQASAREDALYVAPNGYIGLGTSVPSRSIHVFSGNAPGIRLEQDESLGLERHVWDIAGNDFGFFISNPDTFITPFVIRAGAYHHSIVVGDEGKVGFGTFNPTAALHLAGHHGDTGFLVEETSTTEQARLMTTLRNNGRVLWTMEDTSPNGTTWRFRTVEGQFNFDSDLGAGNEFILDSGGNLAILGTLTENSNREAKTAIREVDPQEVLDKVSRLPLSTWAYKKQQGVSHLGPMAQDFHALFGLGATNTGITTYDTAGVALASIQALHRRVLEQQEELAAKDARITALEQGNEARIQELLRRMEALERSAGDD